jgi:hypothetical protein
MIFDDWDLSDRRLSRVKLTRVDDVGWADTRTLSQSLRDNKLLLVFIGVITALIIVIVLCSLTVKVMFTGNDRFTLKKIDVVISGNGMLTAEEIKKRLGLMEGQVNLFGFNLAKTRNRLLLDTPNLKSVVMTRYLPGTLRVDVVERIPVAFLLVAPSVWLGVDDEGYIFVTDPRRFKLPEIVTITGPWLKPGNKVVGLVRDAVRVVNCCRSLPLGSEIELVRIDARGGFRAREDSLRLYLAGGTIVDLWWKRDKHEQKDDDADMKERINFLSALIKEAKIRGKPLHTVNLTLDSYKVNCSITPAWD